MDARSKHIPDEHPPHRHAGDAVDPAKSRNAGRSDNRESVSFYDYTVSPAARNARHDDRCENEQPDESSAGVEAAAPHAGRRPSVHSRTPSHPHRQGSHHPTRRTAERRERPMPGTPLSIDNVRADSGIGGHARSDVYVSHNKRASWTEAVYKPAKPVRPWGAYLALAGMAIALLAMVFLAVSALRSCSADEPQREPAAETESPAASEAPKAAYDDSVPIKLIGQGTVTATGNGRVTFCAVGDNVINEQLIEFADRNAGESGDGAYDFSPLYRHISPTIAAYDLAFINQETVMGSNENFDFAGYPSFNSPDELAANLVDAGWDMFNCNSNHTYDIGSAAILHEIELWKGFPDVAVAGMHETEEDAQTIRVIERNGIRVAFLSYNYGLNGYENDEVEDGSLVNFFTDEKLERDIPRAKAAADVVVVSMHWGTEYTNEPDETQRIWAQKCADLGADVVVGTHTHFIQPMEWIEGENGGKTLVAWCLGDFASGYTWIDCILGGMMSCDFVRGENGEVTVENVKWTPTIEHMEGGNYSVHFLKDYSAEMAQRNELFSPDNYSNTEEALADPVGYVRAKTSSVIGDSFPIDM